MQVTPNRELHADSLARCRRLRDPGSLAGVEIAGRPPEGLAAEIRSLLMDGYFLVNGGCASSCGANCGGAGPSETASSSRLVGSPGRA